MTPPAPKPSVRVIEELRGLLAEAGKWPDELIPEGDGKYFECPACGGEGSIEGEVVHCLHAGLVGVQVYGIGDQMAAMEKLLPLLIRHGPALIAIVEAAKELQYQGAVAGPFEDQLERAFERMDIALSALDATGGGL